MDESSAEEILKLTIDPESLSVTARIRSLYPSIIQAREKGVSRAAILNVLNKKGFNLSMATFNSILYRIKKETKPITKLPEKLKEAFLDFKKPAEFKRTER